MEVFIAFALLFAVVIALALARPLEEYIRYRLDSAFQPWHNGIAIVEGLDHEFLSHYCTTIPEDLDVRVIIDGKPGSMRYEPSLKNGQEIKVRFRVGRNSGTIVDVQRH